jgi:hypothetical protein
MVKFKWKKSLNQVFNKQSYMIIINILMIRILLNKFWNFQMEIWERHCKWFIGRMYNRKGKY